MTKTTSLPPPTSTVDLILGWIKCWWHCLLRSHRMSNVKYGDNTIWVGCGDCYETHYGDRYWADVVRHARTGTLNEMKVKP